MTAVMSIAPPSSEDYDNNFILTDTEKVRYNNAVVMLEQIGTEDVNKALFQNNRGINYQAEGSKGEDPRWNPTLLSDDNGFGEVVAVNGNLQRFSPKLSAGGLLAGLGHCKEIIRGSGDYGSPSLYGLPYLRFDNERSVDFDNSSLLFFTEKQIEDLKKVLGVE